MSILKCVLILCSCCYIVTALTTTEVAEEKWFDQYLDHFNIWENRTFPQRYLENGNFYEGGGPLLLVIGAETSVNPESLKWNPSYKLAKKLKGMLVMLEHRFYGKSVPFENFTAEDLQYLSVEQALEDLAYFVDTYKKNNPSLQNSKVAAFGCSYGGSLATWFRYKFPHLVDAAWASSGPLRVTLDFHEYYEVAGEMYSNVSKECIAIIRQGYREAKTLISNPEGLEVVRNMLEGWECGNVTEMNATEILSTIRIVVSDQYTTPNHSKVSCAFLESKNSSTSCFQQLAAYVKSRANEVCLDEDVNDNLAWDYQTCTEFGYVLTTTSNNQPFKDTYPAVEEQVSDCADNFGERYTQDMLQRGIDRMNRVYGSTNLKVTKVLTVHGTKDPWHRLGLYTPPNSEAPVLIIPGASHCPDDNENEYVKELPQLSKAKKIGMEIMERWLK